MSTTFQPLETARRVLGLPAIAELSEQHFHICDNCGCECQQAILRKEYQVWRCQDCGVARGWGLGQPWDSTLRPALGCVSCRHVTRHRFVGIVGRGI